MKVVAWTLKHGGTLDAVDPPLPLLRTEPHATPHWVEIDGAVTQELGALVAPLKLHPLHQHDLLDDRRSNRTTVVGDALLLEFPRALAVDVHPHPYVSIVARPDLLVTVLRGRTVPRERLLERIRHHIALAEPSVPLVVGQVLSDLVVESMELMSHLRKQVEVQTDRVLADPLHVSLESIQHLTREVQHAALIAEDQLFSLDGLVASLTGDTQYARLAEDVIHLQIELAHVLKLASRLTEHLRSLHSHGSTARDGIDSARLRMLTVISAIFLPLNLIAGIYGMNFERDADHPWNMPELGWRFGYFAALGAMLLVSFSLLLLFWLRGWIRARPS